MNASVKIIIIVVLFMVVWNTIFKNIISSNLFGGKIADVPMGIKCVFNETGCEEGDLDGWSMMHGLLFLLLGIAIPNKYWTVIIISIIYEIAQPWFGNQPKYIINPLISLTGYAIGSSLSPQKNHRENYYREKYTVFVNDPVS
jgi:hypothetical protein